MKKNWLIWIIILMVSLATMVCLMGDYYWCIWTGGRWEHGGGLPYCVRNQPETVKPENNEVLVGDPDTGGIVESTDDAVLEDTPAQIDLPSEQAHTEEPETVPISPTAITYHGTARSTKMKSPSSLIGMIP